MPNPTDEHAAALSRDLLQSLDNLNGVHPGFRPAHAKGVMLSGVFTPAAGAGTLTHAPHVERPSTPVTVRFSDSAGFPAVADNDPKNASPRGMGIRFHLGEHVHTDIVAHSHDGFPVRTPEEFVEFLRAAYESATSTAKPSPIEAFVGSHPSALAFVSAPKPIPSSFAREHFFAVTAFKFIGKDGSVRFGRYRIRPEGGTDYLDDSAAAAKSSNFLFDDLAERVAKGPVKFHIYVQVAENGDIVNDSTIHWPESRVQVEFGTITLTAIIQEGDIEAGRLIFDPIPRVDGIETSGDPLSEARADVYLLSGRRRRAATKP